MVGFPPPSSEFVCRILDVFYCSVDALKVGTCLVLYIVVYVSQIIISLPLRVVPFSLTVKCRCVFSKRFIIFLVEFFFVGETLSLVWRVGDEYYVNAVLHFVIVLLRKRYLSKW